MKVLKGVQMKDAGEKRTKCGEPPTVSGDRVIYPELYIDSSVLPSLTEKSIDDEVVIVAKAKLIGMRHRTGKKAHFTLELRNIGLVK